MKWRMIAYCLLGGLALALPALHTGGWLWWGLAGMLTSAAFVPIARFGPRGIAAQFGVIAPILLVVSLLCTWSEGVIFMPQLGLAQHAVRDLTGGALLWLFAAAVLAALARGLKLHQPDASPAPLRPPSVTALLVFVCGLAYTLYYLVFGAITFHFFTYRYYPHAVEIATRLGLWLWVIEIARGILMTLAVLPALYRLRMSRAGAALVIGALLWITGGAAPLLLPNASMVWAQRLMHIVEIFTQNASLGVTAALLLRPAASAAACLSPQPERA